MGFELDLAAIRSAAGKRKTDPWLMANPANVANLANENQPNSPKNPEPLAKLAGLATLAISHEPKTVANDPLLVIAMRFADHIKASPQAREDWQRDVLETPPHLRQGLYNYLREQMRPSNLLWRNQK